MKKEPSERIGRYIFVGIRPIVLRVMPAVNPIPQEDRKDFVKFTPAKIEKPK